jgi:protein SCO1/2/putative membrane protein
MHVNAQGRVMGQYNAQNEVDMARLRRVLLNKSDVSDTKLIEKADREEEEYAAQQRRLREQALREDAEEEAAEREEASPAIPGAAPDWVYRLPAVNASLNTMATVLLLVGWVLIKARRVEAHKVTMLSAFVTSTFFLAVYLVYHFALHHFTGASSRKFPGSGLVAYVYFTILISHVLLAITVPVLALVTIRRGLTAQWERHKSLARITFPIWLYVSVTGVIIYFMLYHWPQG